MCDHGVRHCGMPAMNHPQTVRPTGPVSRHARPHGGPTRIFPDRSETGDVLSVGGRSLTQQAQVTIPRCIVVRRSKFRDVSWRDSPQRISCPCVGAEQEQEPSALQILQTLNSFEEGSVFLGGRAELGLHEINVTEGIPRTRTPCSSGNLLLRQTRACGSTRSAAPLHRATPRWVEISTVPHLRLAQVNLNSGMCLWSVFDKFVDGTHSLWRTHHVEIVEVSKQMLIGKERFLDRFQRIMLSQSVRHGHQCTTLLTSFSPGEQRESPPSMVDRPSNRRSGNKIERTDPVNRQDRRSTVQICQRLNCTCTHPPDFVANAYWNGEVAASTVGVIDCAMVRATNLRTMSPHTMPRTPPPGFSKAVNLPMRNNVSRSVGFCALAKSCAARLTDDVSGVDSRITRK